MTLRWPRDSSSLQPRVGLSLTASAFPNHSRLCSPDCSDCSVYAFSDFVFVSTLRKWINKKRCSLLDITIGVPSLQAQNLDAKISEERCRYLVAELVCRVCNYNLQIWNTFNFKIIKLISELSSAARVRRFAGAALWIHPPTVAARDNGEVRGRTRIPDAPGACALRLRYAWRCRRWPTSLQPSHHQESLADSRSHTREGDQGMVPPLPGEAHLRAESAEEVRRGDWEG